MLGEGGVRITIKVSKGHTYTITSRMHTAINTRAVAAMNSCFTLTFFFFFVFGRSLSLFIYFSAGVCNIESEILNAFKVKSYISVIVPKSILYFRNISKVDPVK